MLERERKAMNNIGFLEIITLISLGIYIYLFLKELNREKYLGRLTWKVPRDFNVRPSIFFWSFLGCFWVFLLILRLVDLNMYTDMNLIRSLMVPVLMILMCLYNILEIINDKEIREKGVKIREGGMVYWENITHYKWIKDGKLEIVFQPSFRFALNKEVNKVWTINSEDKEKIDMLFYRYLNLDK